MALSLSHEGTNVVLRLNGCHGIESQGCGDILVVNWNMHDMSKPNVAARLFLHQIMGRVHVLDGILKSYDSGWNGSEWSLKSFKSSNGIDVWKHIILSTLNEDSTWKICPTCEEQYRNGKLEFGEILFITPETYKCPNHSNN